MHLRVRVHMCVMVNHSLVHRVVCLACSLENLLQNSGGVCKIASSIK